MGELGRFMLGAKEMDNTVRGLEDLCASGRFQFVVNVAKCLTPFGPGKHEYGKLSTAVKMGFCLKGAVEILIGQALMSDDLLEKKAKKFFKLLEKNWRKCFHHRSPNHSRKINGIKMTSTLPKM